MSIETEMSASWGWAMRELASGARWLGGEPCIFGAAFLAQLKKELPEAEHAFVSSLQDLVMQVVGQVEKEFRDPDAKFGTALQRTFQIVEQMGVVGVKAALSPTAKQYAIQAGAVALKAGLLALI